MGNMLNIAPALVILLSAYNRDETIVKPFSPTELAAGRDPLHLPRRVKVQSLPAFSRHAHPERKNRRIVFCNPAGIPYWDRGVRSGRTGISGRGI